MAIVVKTDQPRALLSAIRAAIDNGAIETWSYDADGDFTHTPAQWKHKAWLRPSIADGDLIFTTVAPQKTAMTKAVYAVYHGRFIEMLLRHFDVSFSVARATALPSHGDSVGS
jgi:hypothetical protein